MDNKKLSLFKLADIIKAITPLCVFELPDVFCTDEEHFYRRLHNFFNREATKEIERKA